LARPYPIARGPWSSSRGVANLNLSVANVALPGIGTHVDPSQTTQDLIAVGYWLGLAASVLFLGAEAYLLATLDSHERCD